MSKDKFEEARRNYEEKIGNYEIELSITHDESKKFELRKKIEECQKEIERLNLKIVSIETQKMTGSWLGNIVAEDHKYGGRLAYINLGFCHEGGREHPKTLEIRLSISFGLVEEEINYSLEEKGWIKFGIREGELCLSLSKNMEIPLRQRGFSSDPQNQWQINVVGENKSPIWQFKVKNNPQVLQGLRKNEKLVELEMVENLYEVEAVFQIKANSNNLQIIAQDNVWDDNYDKKSKLIKIRTFFKRVVEPKIKKYVSRILLRYERTTIS